MLVVVFQFFAYAGDEVDHELKVYADAIHEGIKEHWSGSYKVMIEPGRALFIVQ